MNLNEIIKIIEDVYHTLDGDIDEMFANEANLLAKALKELYKMQKADVIVIPEGATNGDIVKAMFPMYTEVMKHNRTYFEILSKDRHAIPHIKGDASVEWWNAPYKGDNNE